MTTIMMITAVTATTMITADTLAAITASEFGVLGVIVGEAVLVDGRVQTRSPMSLILTGQSGSTFTITRPLLIVAPCLTQSSI